MCNVWESVNELTLVLIRHYIVETLYLFGLQFQSISFCSETETNLAVGEVVFVQSHTHTHCTVL